MQHPKHALQSLYSIQFLYIHTLPALGRYDHAQPMTVFMRMVKLQWQPGGGGECETLLIGQIVTVHSADGWFLIDKFSNRRVRDFETFVISKKKKEKKITAISFRNASFVSPPV